MPTFDTKGRNPISVRYESWMEGGGTSFGQEYIELIQKRYTGRKFERCFEWCCGPGFIGFGLMAHGLCDSLCLSDIYAPAILTSVSQTVRDHDLHHRVSAHVAGSISSLPGTEKFDLVVANPPHYLECPGDDNYQRIAVDRDWAAHRDFYQHIAKHLTDQSVILIQENLCGSINGANTFASMIHDNGLKITDVFDSPAWMGHPGPWCQIYYIEVTLAK